MAVLFRRNRNWAKERRLTLAAWAVCHILVAASGSSALAQVPGVFATGLIPATPEDIRDVPRPPTYRAFLDERVDLSDLFPTPGDQGSQGSCVAWAVGYAARAYWARKAEDRDVKNSANIPSPTYIFNKTRGPTCDQGSSIKQALTLLRDTGSLSLRQLPYDQAYCSAIPHRLDALVNDFRINGWSYIEPSRSDIFLDNIKGAISNLQPVIIGMRLFFPNGLEQPGPFNLLRAGQIYRTTDAPEKFAGDAYHSFHAMTVVGYDDRRQAFKLINSWRTTWGDRGFGWVDYQTFMNNVDEAWVMHVERPAPPPPPSPPPPTKPSIISFDVNPSSVIRGKTATLSWFVSGATTVHIDSGVGSITGNTVAVTPAVSTEYTLTAENAVGLSMAKTRVTVTEPPPPPARPVISSFEANPSNINKGQSTVLSWSVSGAALVRIDNGIGAVTGRTIIVSPTVPTDYTLTAENSAGITTATAKVFVAPQVLAAPSCALSVSPSPIVQGSAATLTFASQNAEGGKIDNGVGTVPPSGNKSVSPIMTTTYTGAFSGAGGTATCAATIVVDEPPSIPPVISSFNASPVSIAKGRSSVLSWSVTGETAERIDNGVGPVSGNSTEVSPATTTTYTLTVENAAGSATARTTVAILPPQEIVLPNVECGKIALNRLGGKIIVEGFVGYDKDFDLVQASAPNAEIDVKVRPWPQCEALQTLEKALSPSDRPKVSIRRSSGDTLTAGEAVIFDIQTPSYPSYVHVAYIQADGSVINLIQPGDGSFRTYGPNSKIVIGDNAGAGRHFFVKEPFGREMLIVLSGKSPIFPDRRPRLETEREFLTALRRALIAKPDPSAPDRDIVASFDAIVTKDK